MPATRYFLWDRDLVLLQGDAFSRLPTDAHYRGPSLMLRPKGKTLAAILVMSFIFKIRFHIKQR